MSLKVYGGCNGTILVREGPVEIIEYTSNSKKSVNVSPKTSSLHTKARRFRNTDSPGCKNRTEDCCLGAGLKIRRIKHGQFHSAPCKALVDAHRRTRRDYVKRAGLRTNKQ